MTLAFMIQGCCATYAIFPRVITSPVVLYMSPRNALIKEDFPDPTRPTIHDNSPFRAEKSILCRIIGDVDDADHLNVPRRIRTVSSSMYCTGASLLTALD